MRSAETKLMESEVDVARDGSRVMTDSSETLLLLLLLVWATPAIAEGAMEANAKLTLITIGRMRRNDMKKPVKVTACCQAYRMTANN